MSTSRKEELEKCFEGVDDSMLDIVKPLFYDIIFLEEQLDELKKLPFIKVNPKNKLQQKVTPASKLFKEMLQQYNNCLKLVTSILMKNDEEEESPLRGFVREMKDKYNDDKAT